ncbi:hypothetical protein D3C81_2017240 [compost metagenome]
MNGPKNSTFSDSVEISLILVERLPCPAMINLILDLLLLANAISHSSPLVSASRVPKYPIVIFP